MNIFLVAGFFVASLATVMVFGIITLRQYGASALNNVMNYKVAIAHHSVKVQQRAQPKVSTQPQRFRTPKLTLVHNGQSNGLSSNVHNENMLIDLQAAA